MYFAQLLPRYCFAGSLGLAIAVTCFCSACIQDSLAAGTVVNTGFESPYAVGPLQGQQGWVTVGYDADPGASTATVQSAHVATGTQALNVTRAAAVDADRWWFVPASAFVPRQFVLVDWDMRVSETVSSSFGPYLGVESVDRFVPLTPHRLSSLGVDASTGDVMYLSGEFIIATGAVVSFDQWNHFRMLMDFKTDTFRAYLNGNLIAAATTSFVDSGHFSDADIVTFGLGTALSGSAYFDNFVVREHLLGDYDADGDVDDADYTRWASSFQSVTTPAGFHADGNGDGVADAADYVVWRKFLGQSLFTSMGSGGFPVPEPANALIWLTWSAVICQTCRRRGISRRGDK
jgi:hypothetical protein